MKKTYIDRAGRHVSSGLCTNQRLAFVLHNPALPAGVLDVVPQLDLGTIKGSHALVDIEVLAAQPGARYMTLLRVKRQSKYTNQRDS